MNQRLPRIVSAALAVIALSPTPGFASTEPVRVRIIGLHFAPSVVHVKPGQAIVRTNEDQVAHTVTSGDGEDLGRWRSSEALGEGQTFTLRLAKTGTYRYYCKPHYFNPDMHATIVVDPTTRTE